MDYTQAFHASYLNLKITYLDWPAAERLITRPTPDFPLNYDRAVVRAIFEQTHGQPLLIQRICQQLVFNLNHQLFDERIEREHTILSADLDAVLTDEFIRHESRYFDGIWTDQINAFPDQKALLLALAKHEIGQTAAALAQQTGLTSSAVDSALAALARRDLITESAETWSLLMPLFRRWLHLQSITPDNADPL